MVYILLGTGFEETEALAPCDLLRRAGLDVALVGVNGIEIRGSHRITVRADIPLDAVHLENMEMLVLPGGLRGVESIMQCRAALELIKSARRADKYVCAICAAPTVLAKLGLLEGVPATCYPGKEPEMEGAVTQNRAVVRAGRIITGRAAGSSIEFGLALIEALRGADEAARIAKQIVFAQDNGEGNAIG